jgi:hypothetical protein
MSLKEVSVLRISMNFGRCAAALALTGFFGTALAGAQTTAAATGPVNLTSQQDYVRICELLKVEPILKRPSYNYDETKANPFPTLPDALVCKDGTKVTDAATWWNKRRPEIVEDFESEVYGRMPKQMPKVTWEVTTTRGTNGRFPIITKTLVGHVDNSSYPAVTVNIQVILTTPADATGPVPVMMQFAGMGFGFPGGAGPGAGPGRGRGTAPATLPATRPTQPAFFDSREPLFFVSAPAATRGTSAPAASRGAGAFGGAPGGAADPWQQQCLAKGWGYALLNTGSVQADSGAGLTQGIIGLCNKGQPRQLDDWGVLRAWGWGASKALDYFETDKAVNAKQVGLQGHSRWGKATLVAMAFDQRFAIGYVSSSGEGGAKLHRHDAGQPLDAVTIPEEYHWMAGNFMKYMHRQWDKLPVDSHELIGMCAPRPVLITGGTSGDRGADTKGMFMAAAAAGPVYKVLGKKDLGTTEMPQPNVELIDGDVAFRQHEGGHTDAPNWPTFIKFAGRYFGAPTNP